METECPNPPAKMKVALLVNMIAPYRVPMYARLADLFTLAIFHGGTEENRSSWSEDQLRVPGATVKRSWGFQFRKWRKARGETDGVYDVQYLHIMPGCFVDLMRFAPDAIITNELGFRTATALLYGTLARKPVWVCWEGTPHTEKLRGSTRRFLRRFIIPWVKHWISFGNEPTGYLTQQGVPASRIVQVQNGVDESLFAPVVSATHAITPHPVLLYVGQFIGRKGIAHLLECAAQLQHEGHLFSLLLVGGGPNQKLRETQARQLGLTNITFLPPQPQAAMPGIYRSADCLVFPTLEDVWGLVVNEALWSGLPVVASKYAGCAAELLPPECLFDPTNHEQFVEVLRRVVDGRLPRASTAPLWPIQSVANTIAQGILQEAHPRPMGPRKKKVALLVNMIAPYRVPVYARLAEAFELSIFHGGMEGNRSSWQEDRLRVPGATTKRSWGFQVRLQPKASGSAGEVYDVQFVHLAPGYFLDLVRSAPEVVISNEMGIRTILALLYGTLWRKPVWVWWGGTLHTEQKIGKFRKLLRSVIVRWAKHWISYGENSTEYLASLGIPRADVVQIQNCVDERRFAAPVLPTLDIHPRPVLLHVGQFVGRKGISQFLRSAAALQREGLVFSIVLVGSGPNRERVQQLVGELGLSHVTFLPPQPQAAMPGIYRSADCLVFPTLEDVWGLVVNEALWAGLPVIGSIYAGCTKELLPPAAWFDPLNHTEFTALLRRALRGEIPPPNTTRLKTKDTVAALIIEDIHRLLRVKHLTFRSPT